MEKKYTLKFVGTKIDKDTKCLKCDVVFTAQSLRDYYCNKCNSYAK